MFINPTCNGLHQYKSYTQLLSLYFKSSLQRDLFAIDSYLKLQQTLLEGSQIPFHFKKIQKPKPKHYSESIWIWKYIALRKFRHKDGDVQQRGEKKLRKIQVVNINGQENELKIWEVPSMN